jgi:hypothetical protein
VQVEIYYYWLKGDKVKLLNTHLTPVKRGSKNLPAEIVNK